MKIIDFRKKGNLVRFYLGSDDCNDYYGDDWNDAPYEHNAGQVYEEFVVDHIDVVFPFDYAVCEPSEEWCYERNSPWCKDDMKDRKVPCIVAAKITDPSDWHPCDEFLHWLASDASTKIYFGDDPLSLMKYDCIIVHCPHGYVEGYIASKVNNKEQEKAENEN